MGSSPQVGQPVQDFTLQGGALAGDTFERSDYTLSDARGRTVVLAFYPGDNTTVCTKQLCSYSSGMETLTGLDAEVWGISPQGVDSHESFARTYGLRMPLLADTGREIARAYGITAPGIGVRRAVFLIGPDGVLRWKHVAVLGATFQSLDTLAEHIAADQGPDGRLRLAHSRAAGRRQGRDPADGVPHPTCPAVSNRPPGTAASGSRQPPAPCRSVRAGGHCGRSVTRAPQTAEVSG